MKIYLILISAVLCISSCTKDGISTSTSDNYISNVKLQLKDTLPIDVFNQLDFQNAITSGNDSADLHFITVPYRNSVKKDFALIQTNTEGQIIRGRLITLSRKREDKSNLFNGSIIIRSLEFEVLINSEIVGGYISNASGFKHSSNNGQISFMQPAPPSGEPLPDIIEMAHYLGGAGLTYGAWLNLTSMFNMGSVQGMDNNYYGPSGTSSSDYNGSNNPYHVGSGTPNVPLIQIGFETQNTYSAIDITSYLKCFAAIPDNGATCSIEIFTDLPVDNDPNKLFNWQTESPGHTFLQIKKSNGSQSVVQNIGFYPKKSWKTMLTPAPVDGKFVDNSNHEFNASLSMNITPAQLAIVLTHISYLARFIKYDIDEYNCTDFALDVFNSTRSSFGLLEIPMYEIPGGMAPDGTSTPQGLYNQLKKIKLSGSPESKNIEIPGYKGWVTTGKGPCN